MSKHIAIVVATAVRSPTTREEMDGKDRDRDIRVMVAHLEAILGDEVDLIPIIAIIVASRVTIEGVSFLFPLKITFIIQVVLIARVDLYLSRVHRDRPSSTSPVSTFLHPSSSISTNISPRHPVTRVKC